MVVKRQMENLNRGLVAIMLEKGVYLKWRLLGTEVGDLSFNIYRNGSRINTKPLGSSTNYIDYEGSLDSKYFVVTVLDGLEKKKSKTVGVWDKDYLSVPLDKPEGGITPDGVSYTYHANDASVGDLDGDGEYEIVLKWSPSNARDNAHSGYTGEVFIDAYKLNGTRLWRISLGKNIRAGAHYTQFMVYDLDGDGRAELAFKTADGTVDGLGNIIGSPDMDYRNEDGYILEGPEYLSIFDGMTGKVLLTTDYDPPRGDVASWGDEYGNRVDRFLACIAYLDGQRPSLVMCRGYYTRTVLAAYNWRNGKLTELWTFDSDEPGNGGYAGQGNHQISAADVDGDGKDEIIYGGCVIDHNGEGLYTTGLGHGDALHVGDFDPGRPGLEVYDVHEEYPNPAGLEYRDAETGKLIWGVPADYDVGRGLTANIDPNHEGAEVWAAGKALYNAKGEIISENAPLSINFAIWWDGDLLRELLDHQWLGKEKGVGIGKIDKWDYNNHKLVNLLRADGTYSNNYTKGNPCLQADIFGDWREEVIWRTEDSNELRIYTSTYYTEHRIHTLMHDPVYRLGIAWQNVAYNQPPHTGFYIGPEMDEIKKPDIYLVKKNQ